MLNDAERESRYRQETEIVLEISRVKNGTAAAASVAPACTLAHGVSGTSQRWVDSPMRRHKTRPILPIWPVESP